MEAAYFVISLLAANFVMVMSPGPDFVLTLRNTLSGGRACGVATAFGISAGIAVHVAYCLGGVAVIVHNSYVISTILRWLGAAYLIWVGIGSFKTKENKTASVSFQDRVIAASISLRSSFLNGFITNIFNVKALLFFLSVFSIAVSPNSPSWVYATLALGFVSSALIWFSFISFMIDTGAIRRVLERYEWIVMRVSGAVLIILAFIVLAA